MCEKPFKNNLFNLTFPLIHPFILQQQKFQYFFLIPYNYAFSHFKPFNHTHTNQLCSKLSAYRKGKETFPPNNSIPFAVSTHSFIYYYFSHIKSKSKTALRSFFCILFSIYSVFIYVCVFVFACYFRPYLLHLRIWLFLLWKEKKVK